MIHTNLPCVTPQAGLAAFTVLPTKTQCGRALLWCSAVVGFGEHPNAAKCGMCPCTQIQGEDGHCVRYDVHLNGCTHEEANSRIKMTARSGLQGQSLIWLCKKPVVWISGTRLQEPGIKKFHATWSKFPWVQHSPFPSSVLRYGA